MTYRAIIVDDEKMIRQGIQNVIPWHSIGVDSVFTAKSGEEAIGIIREQKPEIMITDIKMDGMTGLELIGLARKVVPEMRVLVLSGYDEFEYARKCIKLQVYDFFLKPVDEKILFEAIKKQVASLNEQNSKKLAESSETRALALTEQLEIETFLRRLVGPETPPDAEAVAAFCKKYHFNPQQNLRVAVVVPALSSESGSDTGRFVTLSAENICREMVDAQSRGLTFLDSRGRIVDVFFLGKKKKNIYDWLQELTGILKDEYSKAPKVTIGNPVEGFSSLRMSYNDAVSLLEQAAEFDNIIQTKSVQKKSDLFQQVFSEFENAMCDNIADREKVMCVFERFCSATDAYNLSDAYMRKCCFELASSFYFAVMVNSGAEAETRIIRFYNSLVIASGADALEITRQFLSSLLDSRDDQNVDQIVEKAKQFIVEHLSEDLSLPKIASMLYISPNYLSRLFKKATSEGFNEYIVRKRIEKAKLLLETTSLKTNQIAALVGYRDTNYFSLPVRKSLGASPKKYRETYQKSSSCCEPGEKP